MNSPDILMTVRNFAVDLPRGLGLYSQKYQQTFADHSLTRGYSQQNKFYFQNGEGMVGSKLTEIHLIVMECL